MRVRTWERQQKICWYIRSSNPTLVHKVDNERLATYMKPDYSAWKAARDRLSTQLRTQQRLIRAENTRLQADYMHRGKNYGEMRELEELHDRLVSDSALRESANRELVQKLVETVISSPENEKAISCLALLPSDNLDIDQQRLYVGLVPALIQACARSPTRPIAIWLLTSLCKGYCAIAEIALKMEFLRVLFGLLQDCYSANEDCKAISWTIRQLIEFSPAFASSLQSDHIHALLTALSHPSTLDPDLTSDFFSVLISTAALNPSLIVPHIKSVLSLIQSENCSVQVEALTLSEKVMTASYIASYWFCRFGMLPVLEKLLENRDFALPILWNLSILCQNLAVDFIWEIVNLKLFPTVLNLLIQGPYRLLEPGIWAFINLISHSIREITAICLEWEVLATMVSLAARENSEIAALSLDCVLVLLECVGREEAHRVFHEELREIVGNLQWSKSKEVANRAETIIDLFCEESTADLPLTPVDNYVF